MNYEKTIKPKQRITKFYQTKTAFLHHEWSEFYPSDIDQPSTENISFFNNSQYQSCDTRAITLSSDSYVVNCYFDSIKYSGRGAAIFLNQSNVHFLVEFCIFVECATINGTYYGGGLYISYADFAMNHVCALKCRASSYSFSWVEQQGRTVNSIYHSSIANCAAQNWHTMSHRYGYIDVQSVNFSRNTVGQYSALGCLPSSTKGDIYGTTIR